MLAKGASTFNDDDGDGQASRRRVNMACVYCRKRKIRCDGEQPCANCSTSSIRCEHVKITPEQNRLARERKAAAKALRTIRSASSSSSTSHSPVMRGASGNAHGKRPASPRKRQPTAEASTSRFAAKAADAAFVMLDIHEEALPRSPPRLRPPSLRLYTGSQRAGPSSLSSGTVSDMDEDEYDEAEDIDMLEVDGEEDGEGDALSPLLTSIPSSGVDGDKATAPRWTVSLPTSPSYSASIGLSPTTVAGPTWPRSISGPSILTRRANALSLDLPSPAANDTTSSNGWATDGRPAHIPLACPPLLTPMYSQSCPSYIVSQQPDLLEHGLYAPIGATSPLLSPSSAILFANDVGAKPVSVPYHTVGAASSSTIVGGDATMRTSVLVHVADSGVARCAVPPQCWSTVGLGIPTPMPPYDAACAAPFAMPQLSTSCHDSFADALDLDLDLTAHANDHDAYFAGSKGSGGGGGGGGGGSYYDPLSTYTISLRDISAA